MLSFYKKITTKKNPHVQAVFPKMGHTHIFSGPKHFVEREILVDRNLPEPRVKLVFVIHTFTINSASNL